MPDIHKGRILCVCEHGNSRSVALAYILKRQGYDAVAMGVATAGAETQAMLCQWADKVIVLDVRLLPQLKMQPEGKLKVYDLGDDIWFRNFRAELMTILNGFLEREPL